MKFKTWVIERDNLHSLVEKCQTLNIKSCEGMKHVIMKIGECTSKMYTLHEGLKM